jgi:demethylmenaquinone methyltransferase/2-methoxy-6-polyprenyl-1,4-benzoquinol methylase
MPSLDHFGFLAPFYDRVIRLQTAEKMIEMANLPARGVILDAGGGTGRVAAALTDLASAVVVADLSFEMLKQAQNKGDLQTVCSYSEKLPFADDAFERVIMVDALHHVHDQRLTASELWRVVKVGGRIVVEEPDIGRFSVKLVALAEKAALMRSHFISPPAIERLFSFSNAKVTTHYEGFNAWVVIDKLEV